MSHRLVDTLADLHSLDPAAVGLGDFGRPDGYMPRQLRTWSRQWDASKFHEVPEVSELARRLHSVTFAEPQRAAVLHGDYRLDNCIFDAADPTRINAVLDWELSTLGDPLADLGMLLFYWCEDGDAPPELTPNTTAAPRIPDPGVGCRALRAPFRPRPVPPAAVHGLRALQVRSDRPGHRRAGRGRRDGGTGFRRPRRGGEANRR